MHAVRRRALRCFRTKYILTVRHMNDASGQTVQQTSSARRATNRVDRAAAVEAWSALIETTRNDPALYHEHAAALIRLGSLKLELGRTDEAERLLSEAITFGERHLGADHQSLAVALNELSRLYVRQKNFARAEPMLRRLVQITRAKGDRHPDVATALAGLAVAKRGLGDDASAERLYRHALRIREEVLAPDHMAIVITLEQLGDTCAARGLFAEALVHLQRALLRREATLGGEHATVQAIRARIADLHRRNSESLAKEAGPPPAPPAPPFEEPASPASHAALIEAAAPTAAARTSAEWRATPLRTRAVASVTPRPSRPSELGYRQQAESAAPAPARPSESVERASSSAQSVACDELPVAAVSQVAAPTEAATIHAASVDDPTSRSSTRRTAQYASAGAVLLVLGIAGFAFSSPARPESGHVAAERGGESLSSAVVRQASMTSSPAPVANSSVERRDSAITVSAGGVDAGSLAPTTRPTATVEHPAAPSVPAALASLRKIVIPKVATPNLDSVMQISKVSHDLDVRSADAAESLLPSTFGDGGSVIPPSLIGSAPTPRFPDELRAHPIDGDVIVQFRVNEKGRVDPSSMQVLQSQHELFTAAVRNILPQFRFQPAHSGTAGSKPQPAWVQFRTRFDARR